MCIGVLTLAYLMLVIECSHEPGCYNEGVLGEHFKIFVRHTYESLST